MACKSAGSRISVNRYNILISGRTWGYYNVKMRIAPPLLPSAERKRRESHLHADRRRPCRQRPASRTSGSAPRWRPGACRVQRTGTVARHTADRLRSGTSRKRPRRCESRGHRRRPRRGLLLQVPLPLIADGSASSPPLSVTTGCLPTTPAATARLGARMFRRRKVSIAWKRVRWSGLGTYVGLTGLVLATAPDYAQLQALGRDQPHESATRRCRLWDVQLRRHHGTCGPVTRSGSRISSSRDSKSERRCSQMTECSLESQGEVSSGAETR